MTATKYRIAHGMIRTCDGTRALASVGGGDHTELESLLHRANTQPGLVDALNGMVSMYVEMSIAATAVFGMPKRLMRLSNPAPPSPPPRQTRENNP